MPISLWGPHNALSHASSLPFLQDDGHLQDRIDLDEQSRGSCVLMGRTMLHYKQTSQNVCVQGWDQAHQQAAAQRKTQQEVAAAGLAEMCQRVQDLGERFYPNEASIPHSFHLRMY